MKQMASSNYTVGAQKVGKEIGVSCAAKHTQIAVSYDGDVALSVEDQNKNGPESIVLTCGTKTDVGGGDTVSARYIFASCAKWLNVKVAQCQHVRL
jgi:hypothetical protein